MYIHRVYGMSRCTWVLGVGSSKISMNKRNCEDAGRDTQSGPGSAGDAGWQTQEWKLSQETGVGAHPRRRQGVESVQS